MIDYNEMSGPDLVKAYNEMAPKMNFKPVAKFAKKADGVRRCETLAKMIAAQSTSSPKKAKEVKAANGIKIIPAVETNPKKKGSTAAARFSEMCTYVSENPDKDLGDVIKNTKYRMGDYEWDLDRGFIKRV